MSRAPSPGVRRRACAVLVTSVLITAGGAATAATPAQALSTNYCGYLIESSFSYGQCDAYFATWTYNSATYNGSGTIDELCVRLHPWLVEVCAISGTFVNMCLNNSGSKLPRLRQYDGGARHTIYGRADDSPNHTGCFWA